MMPEKPSKWAHLGQVMNPFEVAAYLKQAISAYAGTEHGGVKTVSDLPGPAMKVEMGEGSAFEIHITRGGRWL